MAFKTYLLEVLVQEKDTYGPDFLTGRLPQNEYQLASEIGTLINRADSANPEARVNESLRPYRIIEIQPHEENS